MGEKAKKERAQVARLAKKAKRNAGQLSKPSDKPSAPDNPPAPESNYPPEPTAGSANTNKQKLTSKQLTKGISLKATALISKSSAPARSNPPHSRSTSAVIWICCWSLHKGFLCTEASQHLGDPPTSSNCSCSSGFASTSTDESRW